MMTRIKHVCPNCGFKSNHMYKVERTAPFGHKILFVDKEKVMQRDRPKYASVYYECEKEGVISCDSCGKDYFYRLDTHTVVTETLFSMEEIK